MTTDSDGAVINRQSWTYDADGNVLTSTDGDGNTTTNTYDGNLVVSSVVTDYAGG